MGKTRDFFKKIRDTKDTNSMDLTEAEDFKKRWQEYTEGVYKKFFMTQITTMVLSSPRAKHPGMQSQVGLRKQQYKQS